MALVLLAVLMPFFGRAVASAFVLNVLSLNVFDVGPPHIKRPSQVIFKSGQPLGFYGSWPVFALAHHAIVWLAADNVYPRFLFRRYAILGDDVVIGDREVTKEYARLGF
ncbi:uncharacterized protein LOC110006368 [Amborella trichopoda]|uniref:uncharacterized protein LOC110006368 n=1 Tax=Amborella trichopoda TaxID=13333 RepID=UPI0009BD5D46|nr:uncharacterized protein LOC110006368 [Amborella trichopoda]|eukprot:XP_020518940.1 uncharacterized protein LOC110006368 [Amborella trichopoda]